MNQPLTLRCSTPTLHEAVELATKFEAVVKKYGYHIGLTGSVLYGNNQQDIDFIVYTHHADVCWPKIELEDMLKLLGCQNVRSASKDYADAMVFKANHVNQFHDYKIDFLVLESFD